MSTINIQISQNKRKIKSSHKNYCIKINFMIGLITILKNCKIAQFFFSLSTQSNSHINPLGDRFFSLGDNEESKGEFTLNNIHSKKADKKETESDSDYFKDYPDMTIEKLVVSYSEYTMLEVVSNFIWSIQPDYTKNFLYKCFFYIEMKHITSILNDLEDIVFSNDKAIIIPIIRINEEYKKNLTFKKRILILMKYRKITKCFLRKNYSFLSLFRSYKELINIKEYLYFMKMELKTLALEFSIDFKQETAEFLKTNSIRPTDKYYTKFFEESEFSADSFDSERDDDGYTPLKNSMKNSKNPILHHYLSKTNNLQGLTHKHRLYSMLVFVLCLILFYKLL